MHSSAGTAPEVEAKELVRSFGRKNALSGASFTVHAGECLALFGPNGAGKTTLLRTLAGLLRPTSGEARIEGRLLPGGPEVRARIGIVSHHSLLYDALTALENVSFAARLYSVAQPEAAAAAVLQRMGLSAKLNAPVRSLSRGMQQRVSISRAMVHSPAVILADEPYSGLDDEGSRSLTTLLGELRASGAAMIVVTHNIPEGLNVATHAAVMSGGKMVSHLSRGAIDEADFPAHYRALTGNVQ